LKITREFKIGLFTVVTAFLIIWGINYLKGKDIFSRQMYYYAVYDDVTGLIESNPVSINGVKVGQVNSIRFLPDGSGRILVENIISRSVHIPKNSISQLTGASLMGNREIIIILGDSNEMIQNGDTLQSGMATSIQEEVSQMVTPIKHKADELFIQIDSILEVFQSIFNTQTRDNIVRSFASIQSTLENLETTTGRLDQTIDSESVRISSILANAESITSNLSDNNDLVKNILQNFSSISDSIAAANLHQTLVNAEKSLENLNNVLAKIERGEGSIGLLVNDEGLYNNLESSSKQLELLLEDIRKNPGSYINFSVFGGR
jgi:phospholipid/cholesterol/gamma-HCH transport system substrate-binding protein